MKKFVFGLILCLVCLLVSCTTTKKENEKGFTPRLDTEKTVELKVYGSWENFEALDAIEIEFNKYYPNVSINYNLASQTLTTLENLAPTGDMDLFFLSKNANAWADGDYGTYYRQYMVDLNTTGIDLSNISPAALACGQEDGKQYCVHFLDDCVGLIVNEDLLKSYGYDVPTSYAEFVEICEGFKEKSGDGAVLAFGKERMRVCLSHLLKNVINSSNRNEMIANINEGIASDEVYAGLIDMSKKFESEYFNSATSTVSDNYNACIVEFFNGNIPFLYGTTGTFSGCAKREAPEKSTYQEHPFKYSFIPFPNGEKNESTVVTISTAMFSVLNTSKNVDYATEFLRFMLMPENMSIFSLTKGMPSTNVKVNNEKFASMSKLNQNNVYSLVNLNLPANSYNQLRNSLDGLKNADVTVEELKELFKTKMGK